MRDKVTSKLKSKSGASLSVALLFFVVCAAIAAMVFASAYVAVGRVQKLKKDTQMDYAYDSVEEIVKAQIRAQDDFYITMPVDEEADPVPEYFWATTANNHEKGTTLERNDSLILQQLSELYQKEIDQKIENASKRATLLTSITSDTTEVPLKLSIVSDEIDSEKKAMLENFTITFCMTANSLTEQAPSIDVKIKQNNNSKVVHIYCTPDISFDATNVLGATYNGSYTYQVVSYSKGDFSRDEIYVSE